MRQAVGRQNLRTGWGNGYVEWEEDGTICISVVFSWQREMAIRRAEGLRWLGYKVKLGGPAMCFEDNGEIVIRHNPQATFTSRGCIRHCEFCPVPKLEGDLRELEHWTPRPIVCDNNLLACSRSHFDRVIDSLKPLSGIDFNQGLDARLLTPYHASRLAELDLKCIRLAWDFVKMEQQVMDSIAILRSAGIPKNKIRVFVLIGFRDNPEDALYRLETLNKMNILPNPMRYQPIDTLKKNSFVAPGWTNNELTRYMRYWANLRIMGSIPFNEFEYPLRPMCEFCGEVRPCYCDA